MMVEEGFGQWASGGSWYEPLSEIGFLVIGPCWVSLTGVGKDFRFMLSSSSRSQDWGKSRKTRIKKGPTHIDRNHPEYLSNWSNDHDCLLTISLGKGEEKSCQWKPRLHLFWGTMKRPKRAGLARVHWPHLTAKGHWAPWWGAARRTWFCFWLSGFWAPPIEGLWSCSGSGGRASTEWVSG